MTVNTPPHALRDDTTNGSIAGGSMQRPTTRATETKPAVETTEFAVHLVSRGPAKAGRRAHRDA